MHEMRAAIGASPEASLSPSRSTGSGSSGASGSQLYRIDANLIQRFLVLLEDNPFITRQALAEQLGVSKATIARLFANADELFGVEIKRVGGRAYGHYEIADWGVFDRERLLARMHQA